MNICRDGLLSLHVSPRTAPSEGAKLCTSHHWFGRPSNLRFEPYYELPMGISKLRALVQVRLGSHTLPIEQGRFARLALQRHLHRCTVCNTQAWAMSAIVCLIALISVTSEPEFLACSKMLRGACVCSCGTGTRSLSAIVSLPCCKRLIHEHRPQKPGWLNGRSESLSLSELLDYEPDTTLRAIVSWSWRH